MAIAPDTFFIILLLIKSGPDALFVSSVSMISFISSSVIIVLFKTLSVRSVKGGYVACESSTEEILKSKIRIQAISFFFV